MKVHVSFALYKLAQGVNMPNLLKAFYNQLKNIIALLLHKFVKVVNNIFKMA